MHAAVDVDTRRLQCRALSESGSRARTSACCVHLLRPDRLCGFDQFTNGMLQGRPRVSRAGDDAKSAHFDLWSRICQNAGFLVPRADAKRPVISNVSRIGSAVARHFGRRRVCNRMTSIIVGLQVRTHWDDRRCGHTLAAEHVVTELSEAGQAPVD